MGGLRKIFSGLTLALLVAPIGAPAHAMPGEMQEMVRLFASCAGRYSATMEHEWLMGRDGRAAEAQRRGFVALLDAVLPDARAAGMTGPQVLNLRIEAKFAQAQLLQTASFHDDPARRDRAAQSAAREIIGCRGLLLS